MKATLRLMFGLSATALISLPVSAHAALPPDGSSLLAAMASVGQEDADADPRQLRSDVTELLRRARQAMEEGNVETADSLITRAESMNVSFGYLHWGDTPAKARRDLERLGRQDAGPEQPSQRFAPSTLLDRFSGRSRDGNAAPTDPFKAHPSFDDVPVSSDALSKARVYLFKARKELARGDVEQAKHWYRKTTSLGVEFGPQEADSPAKLLADLRPAGADVNDLMAEADAATASRPPLGPGGQALPSATIEPPADDPMEFPFERATDQQFTADQNPFSRSTPSEPPTRDNLGRFESTGVPQADESLAAAPAAAVPPEIRQHSNALLVAARKALAAGDLRRSQELIAEANQMNLPYDPQGDSPAKVEGAIRKVYALQSARPQGPAPEAYRRQLAESMIEQADALLRWRALDEAEQLASRAMQLGVQYHPGELQPQSILDRVASARGGREMPADLTASFGTAPGGEAPSSDKNAARVRQLLGEARRQLQANELATAERLAREAESLQLPDAAYGPDDERPWSVLLDIQSARIASRSGNAVAPAVVSTPQPENAVAPTAFSEPVTSEMQQPVRQSPGPIDQRFEFPAEHVGSPFSLEPLPKVPPGAPQTESLGPNPSYPSTVAEGISSPDAPAQAQPRRVAQLQQPGSESIEVDTVVTEESLAPNTLMETAPADQQLIAQQMSTELFNRFQKTQVLAPNDPQQAMQILIDTREMVEAAELETALRERFLRAVANRIADLERFMEENRVRIELDAKNAAIRADVERDRMVKLEVDERLAKLVDDYNKLMDERRFAEAEVLAKQAAELDPENPVVVQLKQESRLIRAMMNQYEIRDAKEEGFLAALASVDESSEPFDDRRTMVFGKNWSELSERRRAGLPQEGRIRTQQDLEIERKLRTPVELRFDNAPLGEVMRHLAEMAKVNLHLDLEGLAQEGITSDTPVSVNLNDPIQLKSALNVILEPYHLSYVIKDEVLKITSEEVRHGKTYSVMYNVADLVIPIPNFVASGRMGLAANLHDAYGTLGYGGPLGFGGGGAQQPLQVLGHNETMDATSGANRNVLAQMGGSGSYPGLPGGSNQPIGAGPGGAGGGALADFDSLIQLITSTVGSEEDWEETGGPGRIEPFPLNLSLVISTTEDLHQEIVDLLDQLRRLQDLQVTIEVRFITLSDSFFERIGVDFNFDIDDDIDRAFQVFGRQDEAGNRNVTDVDHDNGDVIVVGTQGPGIDNFTADLDVPFRQGSFGLAVPQFGGFQPGAGATLGFAILSDLEAFFFIEASQGDRRTNILQAPKVTLFNGQQASVIDIASSPFVISVIPVVGDFAAAQQPVIVVLNEGTQLTVQAVVSPDRRFVRLTLVPMFSRIGDVNTFTFTGSTTTTENSSSEGPDDATTARSDDQTTTTSGTTVQLPTFAQFSVATTVSVPDGGSVLLGGIKRLSEGRTEAGVPVLNKLPYVNRLFSNTAIGRETTSLMMMVTPRIIIQAEEEALLEQGAGATP